MYIMLILEILLRILVGFMKPIQFLKEKPPGATQNWVLLPMAFLLLLWSLISGRAQNDKSKDAVAKND